jgi:hypothetical protein
MRAKSIAKQTSVAELRRVGREVVEHDLRSIASRLTEEFGPMAGKRLLVTGGAGSPGYHFVRAIHHHNPVAPSVSVSRGGSSTITCAGFHGGWGPRRPLDVRFVDIDDFEYVIP